MTGRSIELIVRDAEMLLMWRSGKTLQEVGEKYGITRERVRQCLAELGVDAIDGGGAIKSAIRIIHHTSKAELARREKVEANKRKRWGISGETYREIRSAHGYKPFAAFSMQRKSAKNRGIGWEMKFSDWWRIWQESGHWAERGPGRGYCMARWGDSGPYSPENVYICTVGQNFSDSYIVKPFAARRAKYLASKKPPATPTRSGEGKP